MVTPCDKGQTVGGALWDYGENSKGSWKST